ncbi:MAG: hypothetical protein HY287_01345 [Planctomycetes bacterium]|nr:hypothetical protein [Planctomycetota bacterium]MBI3832952.1 hypothetical protein [Planctomycetota bacterium]
MRAFVVVFAVTLVTGAGDGQAGEVHWNTPSDDRWQYPFNFSPGSELRASTFGSTGDPRFTTFNDRDGIFVVGWDTSETVPTGLPAASYGVQSVQVVVTAAAGAGCPTCLPVATWLVDLTPDPWFQMDFPITDSDPGQPIELYGVGFGPEYDYATWLESDIYVGSDDQQFTPRDPYPFVYGVGAAQVHVEDSVKGQFTPTPWAIGVPVNYSPGVQTTPFAVDFDVDLSLSGGLVRNYFQGQLGGGRVFVDVTSLTLTSQQAAAGYPVFFTKEGINLDPNARAAQLVMTFVPTADIGGNGMPDLTDFGALQKCSAGPGSKPSPALPLEATVCKFLFDLDEDGDVDLHDAAVFWNRFRVPNF